MVRDKRRFFLIIGIVASVLVFLIIIIPFCVRLIIGFSHPWSTDAEGLKMSRKIMEAIEEEEQDQLKWLFCKQSIATQNLDEEIEGAFEFIEGNITIPELEMRDIRVSGGEAVDEGKITRMDLSVDIDEITTDAGKEYSMHFYAYAVNQKHEEKVGIWVITIYDEDSDAKYTIGEYIR